MDFKPLVPKQQNDESDSEDSDYCYSCDSEDERNYYSEDPDPENTDPFKRAVEFGHWANGFSNTDDFQYCALPQKILLKRHRKQITGYVDDCDGGDNFMCDSNDCIWCNLMEKLLLDLVYESNDRFELEPFYDPSNPAACDLPYAEIPSYYKHKMHANCDGSEYNMCTVKGCEYCNSISDYLAKNNAQEPATCELPYSMLPFYYKGSFIFNREIIYKDCCEDTDLMCLNKDCIYCNEIEKFLDRNAQTTSRKRSECPDSPQECSRPKRNRSS